MQPVWQLKSLSVLSRAAGRMLGSLVPLLLAGCDGPFSALDPGGPAAREAVLLWWGMFIGATVILLVVIGLWLHASARDKPVDDERHAKRIAQRWIVGGGLILPFVVTLTLLVFGIPAGHRMMPGAAGDGEALRIEVTGHQWWWDVFYPDSGIRLRDELHIPAGVPVDIHLTSADVVHSFWVPRLAGKLDMLPGRSHVLRLQADEAGIYRGQCAEFCGLYHAHMQFTVTAYPATEFADWATSAASAVEQSPAAQPQLPQEGPGDD